MSKAKKKEPGGGVSLESDYALADRALAMLATGVARRPLPPQRGPECGKYEELIDAFETLDSEQNERLNEHLASCDHCLGLLFDMQLMRATEEYERKASVIRFPVELRGASNDRLRLAAAGPRGNAPVLAQYSERAGIIAVCTADPKHRLRVDLAIDGKQAGKGVQVRLEWWVPGRNRAQKVLAKGETTDDGGCVLGDVEEIRQNVKRLRAGSEHASLQIAVRRPAKRKGSRK